MAIRKNISLEEKDYLIISDYIIKNNLSFSEFLRNTALEKIRQEEDLNLVNFLNSNIGEISVEEQQEIDKLNLNFDDIDGKELTLDDIL